MRTILSHSAAPTTGLPPSQLGLSDTTGSQSSKRAWTAERDLCLQDSLSYAESDDARDAGTAERAILGQSVSKAIDEPHGDCEQEPDPRRIFFRVLGESILERGISSRVRRGSVPVTVTECATWDDAFQIFHQAL